MDGAEKQLTSPKDRPDDRRIVNVEGERRSIRHGGGRAHPDVVLLADLGILDESVEQEVVRKCHVDLAVPSPVVDDVASADEKPKRTRAESDLTQTFRCSEHFPSS